jgi:hypothetical protein
MKNKYSNLVKAFNNSLKCNPTCQALLEQAQEFEKMILGLMVKGFKPLDKEDEFHMNGWNDSLKELLKEVQGEKE